VVRDDLADGVCPSYQDRGTTQLAREQPRVLIDLLERL
jgi:hypothetical protein